MKGAGGSDPYSSVITRYSGDGEHIRIKSAMEGYPVTVIGEGSFSGNIVSVVIPETVKSIGDRAFMECTELKDVHFLGPLPQIGTDAFAQDVVFNHMRDSGGWEGYSGHTVREWDMPVKDGIRYYVSGGEATVQKLMEGSGSINIPDSVEFMGNDYMVTSVGAYSFYGIREGAISVNLGTNVKTIDERAFYKCEALRTINIDGIEHINDEAFRECTNLTWDGGRLVFPDSVRYLGFESFRMCHSLLYVKVPGSVEFFGGGVLRASNSLKEADLEVRELPPWSLDNCARLKTVTLRTVITIGDNAFMNDAELESITLPATAREIGSNAFNGCSSLSSLSLGRTEVIGDNAFKGCVSLTSVIIPSSVVRIGNGAFSMCGLTKASFEGDRPEMGVNIFAGSKDVMIECTSEHAASWSGYDEYPVSVISSPSQDIWILYVMLALIMLSFIIIYRRTH